MWTSKDFGYRAGLFPWAIGLPTLALAIVQVGTDLLGRGRKGGMESMVEVGAELPKSLVYHRTAVILGWIIGFYVAIWLLGFSLGVPVMTLLYLKIAGREKWPITLILTIIAWGFFYGLFDYALHIPFPDPVLQIPFPKGLLPF